MNINVKESEWEHFWEEPPGDTVTEFWSMGQWKPKTWPGDLIVFRFNGLIGAVAVVDRVEKPGQSSCATTGRFSNGWKVHWRPETFVDLRGGATARLCARCKHLVHDAFMCQIQVKNTQQVVQKGVCMGKSEFAAPAVPTETIKCMCAMGDGAVARMVERVKKTL